MNIHDIELPPLPKLPMNDPAAAHKILNDYGKACANAAIESDRQRRGEPEGWQLVPKELMRLMPEVLASLKGSGVDVSLAADVERVLATAPKFGEEE